MGTGTLRDAGKERAGRGILNVIETWKIRIEIGGMTKMTREPFKVFCKTHAKLPFYPYGHNILHVISGLVCEVFYMTYIKH
jgi:hypothetical protein